ncbi:MAG: acyl-CoA thioesterase [Deltaproteobacteria bacterium]|nr:acyl-CoA thioesterase [Deltaproteobacteria bacterium]MBW2068497.1 acyl-CoA thioesterase [Deltaproteobacteria bacterium]
MSEDDCWIPARVKVYYADTDKMGFAYYGNYMKWFEAGRNEWFRNSGKAYRELEEDGCFLPVVEAYCRYHRPAFYDDTLIVKTKLTFPSPARLKFEYRIFRENGSGEDDELLAEGFTIHACVGQDHKPRKPPILLRRLVNKRE